MTLEPTQFLASITLARTAVSAALGGSLWAMIRGKGCPTCQLASGLTGGLPLGRVGAAFYLLALSATFLPNTAPVAWALAAAAGAHAVLAGLLLLHRVICRPCLLTAGAAALAATAAIAVHPAGNRLAILAAPLAGLAAWFAIGLAAGRAARRSMQQADRLLADAVKNEPSIAPGRVKMIVLYKPHCHACVFLKESVLPELEREFAGILEVEHRLAPPRTPAPTLLILGKASLPFIGAAPAEAIAPSIRMALGLMPAVGDEMHVPAGAAAAGA